MCLRTNLIRWANRSLALWCENMFAFHYYIEYTLQYALMYKCECSEREYDMDPKKPVH